MSAAPGSPSAQQFRPVDFDPFESREGPIVLPLTPAQQEVWMAAQMGADASASYNQSFPMRLVGPLSIESMRTALAGLAGRHEALRATFSPSGDTQTIAQATTLPLTLHDLSHLPAKDRQAAVDAVLDREVREPFDLTTGPLARLHILREAASTHTLIMTAHHLVCDGWSSGILLRDLAALYTADRHGIRARLAEPMSYTEYVRGAAVESEERVASEQYWLTRFADGVPTLELPTDRPRPLTRTFRASHECLTIDAGLYRELKRLGAHHGCSLYVTLLAAWQTLLFRLTHDTDVVVGIPVAGQATLGNDILVGHSVHVLPLRTRIEPSSSFAEHLVRVRRTLGDAHEHRAISLGQIAPLRIGRDPVQTPLVAVVFNVDPAVEPPQFHGLTLERLIPPRSSFNFEVGLDIADTGAELQIECNYNSDLFDSASIRLWLDCYHTLLASAAGDDGLALNRLFIISPDHLRVLRERGRAGAAFDARSVVQEFEDAAAKSPHAIAVSFDGNATTYEALNRRANQVAHLLRELGVTRDTRVGICLERSVDLIVAIVGVLKARGAYVPFEPSAPTDRIRSMVDQAEPRVIITSDGARHHFATLAAPIVDLDRDREQLARQPSGNPVLGSDASDLAYVIFTSGSTGQPKGVAVTHGNLSRLFSATDQWFHFGPDDVWTAFHSFSFDFSVWELWGALRYGGRLVVVPYTISRSPDAFLDLIEREQVTVLNQTPSAFRQLIDAERTSPHALSRLRLVIFGGEALDLPSLRQWVERHGDERPALVNMYGITETTVHVTYRPIRAADLSGARSRIGVQMPDLELHLLDPATLELVPEGTVGEIAVGGAGVARGYLNKPELSATRFVPNVFGGRQGDRLYLSGDLARRRNDGDLEYLGRADDQLKIRGFRIEPGEIEAALIDHASVCACAVTAATTSGGDRRLAAYVVAHEGRSVEASELREYLSRRLPDYMIPAAFVVLDAFPLTANGKIDRRALPDATFPAVARSMPTAPRTWVERVVAALWCDVLGVADVDVFDNFFQVGGHSILAVQAMLRLDDALGVKLPIRRFFEGPTVAEIASKVSEAGGARVERAAHVFLKLAALSDDEVVSSIEQRRLHVEGDRSRGPAGRRALLQALLEENGCSSGSQAMARRSSTTPAALSFGQQRLWFLDQFEPDACFYNITNAIRLFGALDRESLRRAIGVIVGRHEVLRTTFDLVDGRPVQVVGSSPSEWPLDLCDLSGLSENEQSAEMRRVVNEEAHRPFDLRRGPILRGMLIRVADEEHVLVLTVHHIAYDGWSHGVFCRELQRAYASLCAGHESPLPELPVQYADYADWQRGHLQGPLLDEQLEYWTRQLRGPLPVLALPFDRPRPAMQTWHGALHRFRLEPPLVEAMRSLGRGEHTTLFVTLLAGFKAFLHRYTAQDDVIVGTPAAGRTRAETEDLIGFFVNTLAVRTDVSGAPTFRTLVGRVRDGVLGAVAHQDVPFERLVEELRLERTLSHSPVFQVLFSLDNASDPPVLTGLRSSSIEVDIGIAKFDLTWWATDGPDGLSCIFEYNTDLFDAETAGRLAAHFERLMAASAAHPDTPIAELPLFGEAERARILAQGTGTSAHFGPDMCVHALVEAQAARTPEAPALQYEGQTLSYAELNARANRLAHYLRQRGVGPESRVGICLERSHEMVVGLLGILKAGGAYVPLDPSYPADRLRFMLEDSRLSILVTQERLLNQMPAGEYRTVCLDRDADVLDGQPSTNPEVRMSVDALAYVIYTSGSTGRPKGAMNSHRGIANRLRWMQQSGLIDESDHVLQKTPFTFDVSVWEFFAPLLVGARLVIARPDGHRDPRYLADVIASEQITTVHFVPSMLQSFLEERGLERCRTLKRVICSGEALSPDLQRHFHARLGALGTTLHNLYGPTETAVEVTLWACPRTGESAIVPIGHPIANTQIRVLDTCLQPVPPGVAGELHIGGVQVGRGYWRRASLTAERFIPDPFSLVPGSRLYKTGDLARFLPDGAVEYLGRLDDQVKVRGFRIELGEIEAALGRHTAVRDRVVVARDGAHGDKKLIAYVVPSAGQSLSAAELREVLKSSLPEYMIPGAFVVLDVLPLTSSGKVDRRALPPPVDSSYVSVAAPVAPRTPAEETIADIWTRALGRQTVSVHDNFFEVGGHSLLAAEVVAGLRTAFEVDVPLVALFKAPTVADLAQAVEALRWAARNAAVTVAGGLREEIEL